METRIHDSEAARIRFSFPEYNLLVVNPMRRAGGLMLLWKKEMDIWVSRYSKHFIDFEVKEEGVSKWRGIGIYGWPSTGDKHLTWRLLRTLKSFSSLPWLCFGDFNEILLSFEKKGWRLGNLIEMSAFQQTCEWCSLNDTGAAGVKFIWDNRRQGEANILKRLDRFLASSCWMEMFPLHSARNLARVASDHGPIFMNLNINKSLDSTAKKFKFEAMWLRDEGLINVVSQAWKEGLTKGLAGDPVALLTDCGDKLLAWNWSKFGHVQRELKQKTTRLEKLQVEQHARDTTGNWVANDEGLGILVSNYFEALFTTSQPSECDDVVRALEVQISDEEAVSLENSISSEEVYGALMQMTPLKLRDQMKFGQW
ncbi:hypothetical protein CTI12_AA360000 [Artemisia annua]|uniref:Endonuclease/exonuclease/phosphatase domain-containing protein n=1 Tax=Artemisia annua TaxID=35608 RepID=A0A2U1MNU7_ARTAN|nr:hypothetical protein CTI12_AA360000 [Artemisia annua]